MVWDRGTFHVEGNPDALKQLEKGEIKFSLNGEKLKGKLMQLGMRPSRLKLKILGAALCIESQADGNGLK